MVDYIWVDMVKYGRLSMGKGLVMYGVLFMGMGRPSQVWYIFHGRRPNQVWYIFYGEMDRDLVNYTCTWAETWSNVYYFQNCRHTVLFSGR